MANFCRGKRQWEHAREGPPGYCRVVQREGALADYYPLVLQAVAGLDPDAPRESRRALYERARTALIEQLSSVYPALPQGEMVYERQALEEAIRRVEDDYSAGRRPEQRKFTDRDGALDDLTQLIARTAFAELSSEPATAPRSPRKAGRLAGMHRAKAARARLDAQRTPLPKIEVIPEQNAKSAIAFRPSRRGPLELLPDPPKDPHDPEQSQLYYRIRQQLHKLQADIPSQERAQIDDAVSDFLAQPVNWPEVEFKKVLWLCGNALRNILAQHDTVKDDPEPHYSKLPPAVAEALRRPVEAWNVFVLGDIDFVQLDAKRLGPQEQKSAINDINTAKSIVEGAAADRNITTEQTAKVLNASLHAASTTADNINARQAQQVVAGTIKNLITQLVRRAYLTCLSIADPKTEEDQSLVDEYKRGIARGAGTAAIGTAVAATTFAAPYAVSFFEFVVHNAASIREYFAIASQNPQLVQVVDAIEYVRGGMSRDRNGTK